MLDNHVCYANGFGTDGVLDEFLKSYELFDESKCSSARQFFIRRICNLAKNFTADIIKQGGLDFDCQPGGRTNGRYRLGYEYIFDDSYSGTLKN